MSGIQSQNFSGDIHFNSASSEGKYVTPLKTHHPDSNLMSLCSFSLMLGASQKKPCKYQSDSLWFDKSVVRGSKQRSTALMTSKFIITQLTWLIFPVGILL